MNYLRFIVKRYLFAVLSLIFVFVYWMSAGKLPEDSIIFPRMITVIMIPIFLWIAIQSVREYKALVKDTSVDEKKKWSCNLNITKPKLVIAIATAAYIALIPVVGYCVMTALYVGGLTFFLGNRSPVKIILFTGILLAVLYLLFGVWLRIRLPAGFLI